MKKYIIFPTAQTEGLYGYSSIAIENTPENIADLRRMVAVLDEVHKLDATVSRLVYANARLDIMLFNDDFEPQHDKIYIEELEDDYVDKLCKQGDCSLNTVEVEITSYEIKFTYEAKFTDSKVFCNFQIEELTQVICSG